jgi:hypothetical protein
VPRLAIVHLIVTAHAVLPRARPVLDCAISSTPLAQPLLFLFQAMQQIYDDVSYPREKVVQARL